MTGAQVAVASGALIGLGVALLVGRLLPAEPDLADALARLSPTPRRRTRTGTGPAAIPGGQERLGLWAVKNLPTGIWARTPAKDLAVLRTSEARFFGQKILYAILGLAIPPLLTGFFALLDLTFPIAVPGVVSVGLAVALFFLPDYNARDEAKQARVEFSRALGAYIDLVALERNGGSGPRQALEVAASVGDSWVFRRLSEELARSRWSGQPPWDALHVLADELGLPDLSDLADIMRLAGDQDAQVYTQLRARSSSMRTAMLTAELARANVIEERMYIPASLLGLVFLCLLIAPSILRLLGATP